LDELLLDELLLKDACWPQVSSDGRINLQSILYFKEWAMAKGLLDSKIPIEKMWDPRFVEHAQKVLQSEN